MHNYLKYALVALVFTGLAAFSFVAQAETQPRADIEILNENATEQQMAPGKQRAQDELMEKGRKEIDDKSSGDHMDEDEDKE